MPRKPIDITGDRYGRLIVEYEVLPRTGKERYWECICDCGNTVKVSQSNLRRKSSNTTSCGCYRTEVITDRNINNTQHGLCSHPLYRTWSYMKSRCYHKDNIAFKYYGGRGITVCKEWLNNPEAFINWGLLNGWKEGLTIDRKNSNGEYSPGNCRFATMKEQAETRNPRYTFTPK